MGLYEVQDWENVVLRLLCAPCYTREQWKENVSLHNTRDHSSCGMVRDQCLVEGGAADQELDDLYQFVGTGLVAVNDVDRKGFDASVLLSSN